MIKPTEIRYIKKTNILALKFEDGVNANLTTEYLRCFSPSAEVTVSYTHLTLPTICSV